MIKEPQIRFIEHNHTYVGPEGKAYQGVTDLIKKYVPPFDQAYWSLYKALEKHYGGKDSDGWRTHKRNCGGYKQVVGNFLIYQEDQESTVPLRRDGIYIKAIQANQAEILNDWGKTKREGLDKGSRIHKLREKALIGARQIEVDGKKFIHAHREQNPLTLPESDDGLLLVFTELLLWNHAYQIAGQADLVFKYGTEIMIHDYKTNKKLSTEAFQDERLLAPLDELPNTDISIYTMQLSLYAWMLQDAGYTVRAIELLHCPEENAEPKSIPLIYRPDLVGLMLEDYASTR